LISSVVDWIRLFNALDLLVIVVTNQRGVALGHVDPGELARIHDNMNQVLLGLGARIDDIFYCVHEEGACNCRKPRPGMVIEAARKWNIDLTQSILIGDSRRDEELALACGMAFVAVHEGTVIGRIPAQVYAHAE
jgi:D-glycero-D-manno-heptose 1,7-bisphosphate phosphatase